MAVVYVTSGRGPGLWAGPLGREQITSEILLEMLGMSPMKITSVAKFKNVGFIILGSTDPNLSNKPNKDGFWTKYLSPSRQGGGFFLKFFYTYKV